MRMIRQRTTPLFLMLVLMATAALQVACAENDGNQDEAQASQEQSSDSAQQATDNDSDGQQNNDDAAETQMAANDSGSGGDDAAESSDDGGDASGSDKPYNVSCDGDDCKAGEAVITGYEKYHAHCHTCHGPDAKGASFAPSLVDRGKDLTQGEFTGIVANGKKRYDSTTGGYSVMPAWKDNPAVMENMSALWAYIKARADGALASGEPEPME